MGALTTSALLVPSERPSSLFVGLLPHHRADLGVSFSLPGWSALFATWRDHRRAVLPAIGSRWCRRKRCAALAGAVSRRARLMLPLRRITAGLASCALYYWLAHGVFFAIASTIATDLVDLKRKAGIAAGCSLGLTVAPSMTGVPSGTFHRPDFELAVKLSLGVVVLGRDRFHRFWPFLVPANRDQSRISRWNSKPNYRC